MKITKQIIQMMKRKAEKTPCRTKISALGFNFRGELIARSNNSPRFSRAGGGIHAEEKLFKLAKRRGIRTILICRISRTGNLLPIDPCDNCRSTAEKLGIKIISVTE